MENEKYTQLAREGRFDELPDTCEFSDAVELEVWDNELLIPVRTNVLGKFKSRYVTEGNLCWKYAKVPTPKIDFSEFKDGDIVEVVRFGDEHIYGLLWKQNANELNLTYSLESDKVKCVFKKDIKSITKIK